MSVGATPSLNFIADTVGDTAPHSMSELYGVRFSSGNSPTSGAISLSDFRNQIIPKNFVQEQKVVASSRTGYAYFGDSVDISSDGNTVIVGASEEDTSATDGGAAYIFTRSGTTWTQQQRILPSDTGTYDVFGRSVAISDDGNTAIVGALGNDAGGSGVGAAFVFTRSGTSWSQQAKIQASDKQTGDFFGNYVAISGDGNTVIVGAYWEDTGGVDAGSAYVFIRSGTSWSQQAKIQGSDTEADDSFGNSVAISTNGNTVIVGAPNEDTGGSNPGSAYVFIRSGTSWSQEAKIQASDRTQAHYFGWDVDISSDGNTAIVGSRYAIGAYIFTRSGTTWTQQQKLTVSGLQASDELGHAVSISSDGNTVIVSAKSYSFGRGRAYIFGRSGTTWTQQQSIVASDAQDSDYFGQSLAISGVGNTAIVGAYWEDGNGATNSGAAYIFESVFFI